MVGLREFLIHFSPPVIGKTLLDFVFVGEICISICLAEAVVKASKIAQTYMYQFSVFAHTCSGDFGEKVVNYFPICQII